MMGMADEVTTSISETIATNAAGPAEAAADGTSAKQHSLRDQIATDEYLRRVNANRRQRPPIQLVQIQSPGAP